MYALHLYRVIAHVGSQPYQFARELQCAKTIKQPPAFVLMIALHSSIRIAFAIEVVQHNV
jgi:hypothetical protein